MNILACLNINNYLCQNARESFLAASQRWGCDYAEINTITRPEHHPGYEKFTLARRFASYERVLYLDSDCVVSSQCPNPFNSFGDRHFCVVPDVQPQFTKEEADWTNNYYEGLVKEGLGCLGMGYGFTYPMFNGGFMLFNPWYHGWAFHTLESAALPEKPTWGLEQMLLNIVIKTCCHTRFLDENWCYLKKEPTDPMTCFIQHLHGRSLQAADNLRPDTDKKAHLQKWR